MDQRLVDGSRVCIIGGGPAGSFAALHLLHQAAKRGLQLEVVIFEPRDFTQPGPTGCNRCAGILSSHLLDGLDEIGLALPDEIVQADVQGYAVHLQSGTVRVQRPSPRRRIFSVYRSGGPRLLQGLPQASFDAYILDQARMRGAQVVTARVKQVTWEERPVVHAADQRFVADLLVLAIGVNSKSPLSPEFGYRAPQTETMAQNEILRPSAWPDNQVNVYFTQQPGVMFGALIPKGQYLNVSLLGQQLTIDTVRDFIDLHGLNQPLIGGQVTLCGCTPRIAVRPAPRFFGARWVAVGDAAVARLYKDGIGSAFYTSQCAMTTAVERGVSEDAFAGSYAPYCRRVATDNFYGRMLFRMWALTLHTPRLLRAWVDVIRRESELPPEKRVHQRVLWGMFTGAEPYRTLFWLAISPKATLGVLRSWGTSK